MTTRKIITIVSILILLLAAILGGGWFYVHSLISKDFAGQQISTNQTPFASLSASNSAFAQATSLYNARDYIGALAKYREALATSKNPVEEGQIEIKIGNALLKSGDVNGAIDTFQMIAQKNTYTKITRAYAVQNIGLIYDATGQSVIAKTFAVEPFSSMYASSSIPLSYRHLYEYAVSLYPLAESELRVGDWYASALVQQKKGIISLSASSTTLFTTIARAKIGAANADITRIQADPNEVGIMPEVLKRKALVIGKLAEAGVISLADADAAYRKAMNTYAALGPGQDGFMRYFYAAYLTRVASTSPAITILAPLYSNNLYKGTDVESFFASERDNNLSQKFVLQRLAKVDPGFKQYLQSLGWKDSDF